MKNNGKKIIQKINSKFHEFSTRIKTIDRKREAAELLAEPNQNNISNLTSPSKIVEQEKKIHEIKRNIEDKSNITSRDTLAIRSIKKEIKRKHGITLCICSTVLFVDCLDEIQIISLVT